MLKDGKRIEYKFKYADAPIITRSVSVSMEDFAPSEFNIVVSGCAEVHSLDENIHVRGVRYVHQKESLALLTLCKFLA